MSRRPSPPPEAPDAKEMLTNGWRLFEQRRPGAAEKEFRAALAADASLQDARVGIGMARLSAGNAEGGERGAVGAVIELAEPMAKLRARRAPRTPSTQPEYQPFIRAAHALGCLAYDEERYADAVKDLETVHEHRRRRGGHRGAPDRGEGGDEAGEARRRGGAAGTGGQAGRRRRARQPGARARVLRERRRGAGAQGARRSRSAANAHYGKTLLGRIRRRVENVAGAMPGSVEEALLYAQTYGDVWTDDAKKFLEKALADRPKSTASPAAQEAGDAGKAEEADAG